MWDWLKDQITKVAEVIIRMTKKVIESGWARFLALKGLILSLAVTIIPAVLFKFFTEFRAYMFEQVAARWGEQAAFLADMQAIELYGLAAYVAEALMLAQVLAILLAAMISRFVMSVVFKVF